jgi:hypothetical protein
MKWFQLTFVILLPMYSASSLTAWRDMGADWEISLITNCRTGRQFSAAQADKHADKQAGQVCTAQCR